MKVAAIFGGSFDPPHLGHVLATQYVLSRYQGKRQRENVDAVWWVPCYCHSFNKPLSSFDWRMKLCNLAISTLDKKRVRVVDIEKKIESDGRMLLVLENLAKKYRAWSFRLIIGQDIVKEKGRWYRFNDIEKKFGVIVVPRGQKQEVFPVQSRLIRQRVRRGKSIAGLVPGSVERFLQKNPVYK